MRLWQTNPFQNITISRAESSTVWDTTGKSYVDMLSGTWCNVIGHSHPRWINAVQEQVSRLTHTAPQFLSAEIQKGLDKLVEILPSRLNRAVFLNTGSEAVELSLKIARAATGAEGVAVVDQGYYGATTYALSISEAGRSSRYLPTIGTVYRLPIPNCKQCPMNCPGDCAAKFPCLNQLEEIAQAVEKGAQPLAAVMYEPVISGAGIIVPPKGYGAHVRQLTDRCNALLISEEVTTGMGRTGCWFGFQHENIVPDILVIGKAIGGGLPIAAVVTTEEVERRSRDTLGRHVQSHQNDPFSGHIAATVIDIIQEEKLLERADKQGNYLTAGLKELQDDGPWIKDVRCKGAMLGVQMHREFAEKGAVMYERLLEAGFIVNYHVPSSSFRLFPPFVITNQEIDSFLEAFTNILNITP